MIVRELLARMGMEVDKSGFRKAENALVRLHFVFDGLRDVVNLFKESFSLLGEEVAQKAFDMQKLAHITGLNVEKVQELGFAAKEAGISTEELQMGLSMLSRQAYEAAHGSAESALAFYNLGVRATDGAGKVRPLDQIISEISAKFATMPDGAEKTALAMQVFSRGGARMIEVLNKGPKGLEELGAQAHKLGVVLNANAIAMGVKYREATLHLHDAFEGLRNSIAVKLFPTLIRLSEQITHLITKNRALLSLKMKEAFETFARVMSTVTDAMKGIVKLLEYVWHYGTLGKAAIIGLGLAIGYLVSPWMMLAAAIALVVEDIELFFSSHGKAKTVTGLLVQAFELLRKKAHGLFDEFLVGWEKFKEHPFDFLYDNTREFLKWFVVEIEKVPAIVQKHFGDKIMEMLFGAPLDIRSDAARGYQPVSPLDTLFGSPLDLRPDAARGIDHVSTPAMGNGPAGQYPVHPGGLLRTIFDYGVGQRPEWTMPGPPLGAGSAPSVTFGDIYVQGSGVDGKKAGEDFLQTVKPRIEEMIQEDWDRRMRETHAAVSR